MRRHLGKTIVCSSLVIIACMTAAWIKLVSNKTHRANQSSLQKQIQTEGGRVMFEPRFAVAEQVKKFARSNRLGTLETGVDLLIPETASSVWFDHPGAPVSEASLQALTKLPHLKDLQITGQRLSQKLLTTIGQMTQLEDLSLEGVDLHDQDLVHLLPLKNLKFLSLENNPISDQATVHLLSFTKLKGVFLSDTRITGATLEKLTQLPLLTELGIDRVALHDNDLRHLTSLTARLTYLRIGPSITDEGTRHLAACPNLRKLELINTPISNSGLDRILSGAPNLDEVQLFYTDVTADKMGEIETERPKILLQAAY